MITSTTVSAAVFFATDKRSELRVFSGPVGAMLLASRDQAMLCTALPNIIGQLDGIGQLDHVRQLDGVRRSRSQHGLRRTRRLMPSWV